MRNSELRKALEEYLDLLKRNLAAVSLEVLKTGYTGEYPYPCGFYG